MTNIQGISVFIVEDQPILRVGLMYMLQKQDNIRVVGEASDGKTAVNKVLELRPDVTLMDISLPGLDGIGATRQIKQSWPDARILVLTTHENDDYVFAALAAGADGYCLKSATAEQLVLALDVIKTGTLWLDPGIAGRVLRSAIDQNSSISKKQAGEQHEKFALLPPELEVLRLLVEGLNNQEMADSLATSAKIINSHVRHILEKLAVADRTQAAIKALKKGLVSHDCVTWPIAD